EAALKALQDEKAQAEAKVLAAIESKLQTLQQQQEMAVDQVRNQVMDLALAIGHKLAGEAMKSQGDSNIRQHLMACVGRLKMEASLTVALPQWHFEELKDKLPLLA